MSSSVYTGFTGISSGVIQFFSMWLAFSHSLAEVASFWDDLISMSLKFGFIF